MILQRKPEDSEKSPESMGETTYNNRLYLHCTWVIKSICQLTIVEEAKVNWSSTLQNENSQNNQSSFAFWKTDNGISVNRLCMYISYTNAQTEHLLKPNLEWVHCMYIKGRTPTKNTFKLENMILCMLWSVSHYVYSHIFIKEIENRCFLFMYNLMQTLERV